ncbi:calmodulin 3 [Babesia ovata]|uniref:Calmodulin 3 n=1 Tax=Babesia ovata TaxID=189622 RepID=A0A2H6K9W7_9APIC|nr:calmodulin 3 [Babesia ovata]GBE59780.1 calmodulin 3 [Babesia ovata]
MQKPRFDLSDLSIPSSLKKCKEFLPQLLESNAALARKISEGDSSHVVDAEMRVYRGSHSPDHVTDEQEEGKIVLDVGVGVFDVNSLPTNDESLKASGVTTVTLDPRSEVFRADEPLITEVERPGNSVSLSSPFVSCYTVKRLRGKDECLWIRQTVRSYFHMMMQWESRLAEAFLCSDTQKIGIIQGPECANIYQSLGLSLSRDQIKSCGAMNKDQFVQKGMAIVSEMPAGGDLKRLFEAVQNPQTKTIGTAELQEVMMLMKNRSPQDLAELMNLLDPEKSGKITYERFVDVFSK